MKTTPDFIVNDQGSIVMFEPQNDKAKQWLKDQVDAEDWQWLGNNLTVDHRFAGDLNEHLIDDGFVLKLS